MTHLQNFALALCFSLGLGLALPAQANDNSQLIREITKQAAETGTDHLVIKQNGVIIYEDTYGKSEDLQSMQSVTKSVCALAIAILMDRGAISSIDLPMSTWIPQWREHPQKSRITLKMIMNHTSGLPNDPKIAEADDRIEFAINSDLVFEPGVAFLYSGVATALLQHVIATTSGMSLERFIDENLFAPLEIRERKWHKDKFGHEATGGGLYMLPSDLVKLGDLMLGDGVYKGQRLVSSQSLKLLLEKSQQFQNCGLLWWLRTPTEPNSKYFKVHYAAGWGGQYIVVYPEKNLVAIRTRDPKSIDEDKLDEQSFGRFIDLIAQWN